MSQTIQAQIKGNDCENGDDPWKQGSHKDFDQILAEYLERQKARREAKYKNLSPDYIREHIILDECQAVKSIKSRQHQSISQLLEVPGWPHRNSHVESGGGFVQLL
jgi:hypothetical protein